MKFLVPLRTQRAASPSWRTARVRCALASEPASGSESAKQPIFLPAARSGSQRARCSSVPSFKMGAATSEFCTDMTTAVEAQAREISSSASA